MPIGIHAIKPRQINIELLRILAMLMVLGLHSNFVALGAPDAGVILNGTELFRTFIQSICIVAVNVFVMISGWFGIKSTLRGFCNFLWQVVYVMTLLLVVGYVLFDEPITAKSIISIIGLYGGGGWFVASYIGLYILAPVLNAYVEKATPRNIAMVLSAFFVFEILWGNTLSIPFVAGGYSTFSFIGLYLLAGMLRKFNLTYSVETYLGVFLITTVINTVCYVIAVRVGSVAIQDIILNYINPLVIIEAASVLLAFAKKHKAYPYDFCSQNTTIQRFALWLASSCFAAYLLHVGTTYALGLYCDGVRYLYNSYSGITAFLVILGYILAIFFAAVLIDQPRKLIWRNILLPLFDRK